MAMTRWWALPGHRFRVSPGGAYFPPGALSLLRLEILGHLLDRGAVELVDVVEELGREVGRHVLDLVLQADELHLRLPLLLVHPAEALVGLPVARIPLLAPRLVDHPDLAHRVGVAFSFRLGLRID